MNNPIDEKKIDTEWSSLFHKVVDEILAPRGYEDHHTGKRVAKLEYLTEDRIKKVANVSKRVLDHFRKRLETDIVTSMHNIVYENENTLKELEAEKNKWWFKRDDAKIMELEHLHFVNSIMLKALPEFIKSVSFIAP